MTDHLRRIREHLALETKALLLEAERARLLDHAGNRGSEAEQSILRWLRARFDPYYTVSSGEIIDSFDTNADRKSRQQDGILHRNDPEANRFLLPSGLRLVPVETVAAVVEVKLTLSKEEFEKADAAAAETARLRLRVQGGSHVPQPASFLRQVVTTNVTEDMIMGGLALNHDHLAWSRPMFAVFAFGGIAEVETIAAWLAQARAITLVCCLEAGCVLRGSGPTMFGVGLSHVSQCESALARFGECMRGALDMHHRVWGSLHADFPQYAALESPLPYWDGTGYEHPQGYDPTKEQVEQRERLYQARPKLRRSKGDG